MAHLSYFLGANTPEGFHSLYHQLPDPAQASVIYILKGGPGCGKSSLMARVGAAAQESGLIPEYIYCSGDPASLDAVILPDRQAAIVDGTAPHVIEPQFPGAVERYVDLGQFWDCRGLTGRRDEIRAAFQETAAPRRRVQRCLSAAAQIDADLRELLLTPGLMEKFRRRAAGIAGRELKKAGDGGAVRQRFLSAVTHSGLVCFWETVELQCSRLYVLSDRYGLAHQLLSPLLTAATAAGHDAVACLDPMDPQRLCHLLLPGLSLAFVSSTPAMPCPLRPARRLHLDAMVNPELARRHRGRLRFSQKVSAALVQEAVDGLSQSKAAHDALEALYHPYVDFAGVTATGDAILRQLLEH